MSTIQQWNEELETLLKPFVGQAFTLATVTRFHHQLNFFKQDFYSRFGVHFKPLPIIREDMVMFFPESMLVADHTDPRSVIEIVVNSKEEMDKAVDGIREVFDELGDDSEDN